MVFYEKIKFLFLFVLGGLLFVGCEKFEGDQTVPAYLKIDTINLVDNNAVLEGRLTHDFTDVWVYIDMQVIGAYELPATIPVLASGEHELTVYAGIKFNTMSGTRGSYPFTAPLTVEDFNFTIDSIFELTPQISYYGNTNFAWIEEFDFTEPENISLETTSYSDTSYIEFERDDNDPLYDKLGSRSAIAYIDEENSVFEVATVFELGEGFVFPVSSSPVMLELEYNTTNSLVVGVLIFETGIYQHPILVLNPTGGNQWKKAYVNITPTISRNTEALYYNVFFRADWEDDEETAFVMLDNIKLLRK